MLSRSCLRRVLGMSCCDRRGSWKISRLGSMDLSARGARVLQALAVTSCGRGFDLNVPGASHVMKACAGFRHEIQVNLYLKVDGRLGKLQSMGAFTLGAEHAGHSACLTRCNNSCVRLGGRQEQPIWLTRNFFHGLMSLKTLRVIFIFLGCTCRPDVALLFGSYAVLIFGTLNMYIYIYVYIYIYSRNDLIDYFHFNPLTATPSFLDIRPATVPEGRSSILGLGWREHTWNMTKSAVPNWHTAHFTFGPNSRTARY